MSPKHSRGRPRSSAPAHIDCAQIPHGFYWDKRDRFWYTFENGKRQRLAGSDAKLSDLHRIAEEQDAPNHGTFGWLLDSFHGSRQFLKDRSQRTQNDYKAQKAIALTYPTRIGGKLADARLTQITRPGVQRMISDIGETHPSKAAHLLRYLRVAFRWGQNYGHSKENPADGVKPPRELSLRAVPDAAEHQRVLECARAAGALGRKKGAVAPHLWIVMELCYLCRLRPIEAITLTEDKVSETGLLTNPRKGSADTINEWSPRLRTAVDAAIALRAQSWRKRPIPLRPEDRLLIVSERGQALDRSSLSSAWERSKKVTKAKFGLHAMKHRGVTDTKGTLGEKMQASGHRSESMMVIYDHEVATVKTPRGA